MATQVASRKYAKRALSQQRTGSTFALQMLRDQQKRLELAGRMKQLRENSPYTQEGIADAIGLKLRSYQKAEQTGGMSYEKLQALAELHGVELDWLLKGEKAETPDTMGLMNGNGPDLAERFKEVEKRLEQLESFLRNDLAPVLGRIAGPAEPPAEEQKSTPETPDATDSSA